MNIYFLEKYVQTLKEAFTSKKQKNKKEKRKNVM